MADTIYRPRVFLDIQIGTEPVGRIVLELFTDKAPKTCQNFRSICASSHTPPGGSKPLTYKLSPFHRIIDEFMVQGGDITLGDGTGGQSIYGGEFEDENLGWREIDKDGLLCMANRGRGTNSSQFFITLAPCQHLNAKHTVFGYLVSGKETLDKIASMKVDKNDRPLEDVLVSHCGELERRKRPTTHTRPISQNEIMAKPSGSSDRGRKRDHASRSPSRSASKSPPYSHGHRKYRKQEEQPNSLKQHPTTRRRSDVQLDETRRGRTLTRSPSPSTSKQNAKRSPIPPNQRRKRSPCRSSTRSRTRISTSPHLRRRHTRSRSRSWSHHRGSRYEGRKRYRSYRSGIRREEDEKERYGRKERRDNANDEGHSKSYTDRSLAHHNGTRGQEHNRDRGNGGGCGGSNGRLDGADGDDMGSGGIKFKGRGSMKFREKKW